MTKTSPLLQLDGVGCARGGVALLQDVSFTVNTGEITLLSGPNGVGKTSLLRTIAGLQQPTAGTITVAPDDLAYAAHADGIKSSLSVRENLEFWQNIFRGGEFARAMDAFDLNELADRPAGQLSAGQKRRLGLARLMVTGRPLWIMDEPTVSLDAVARTKLCAVLGQHVADGGAALITSHVPLDVESTPVDLAPFAADKRSTDASFDGAWS